MKKKKLTGFILAAMLMFVSLFTGCSLVETNWKTYYNAVVSTITAPDGWTSEITKRDLITAYNSYGYYYEQYYGQTRQEAVDQTLEQLETRRITLHNSEKCFKDNEGNILSDEEKSYLWHMTNDAIEDNLTSYVNEITGKTNSEDGASTDETVVSRFSYEKKAKIGLDNKVKERREYSEIFREADYKDGKNIDDDKEQIYDNLMELVTSIGGTVYPEALKKYRQALEKSEEGMGYDDSTSDALFDREIDRIYKINYENYMVQKYSNKLRNDLFEGSIDKNNEYDSSVTTEKLLENYKTKVMKSYTKYVIESDSNYESDVLNNLGDVYYFKEGASDTKFFTVSHILIKFEDDGAALTELDSQLANGGIVRSEYNEDIDELYDSLQIKPRYENEEGVFENYDENHAKQTYEKSIYQQDGFYQYVVQTIEEADTDIAKAEAFRELIYRYNEDPGIINAEYNYVMGVNSDRDVINAADKSEIVTLEDGRTYKKYSNMVDEFTLAGIKLYNDGKGKIGDLSEPIRTKNGIHILMYTGACENIAGTIVSDQYGKDLLLTDSDILKLFDTRLNICYNKTYFDLLVDELYTDNFSTFENKQYVASRQGCEFKRNASEIKDLYKA